MGTPATPGAAWAPIAATGTPRACSVWARSRNWAGKLLCTKRTPAAMRSYLPATAGAVTCRATVRRPEDRRRCLGEGGRRAPVAAQGRAQRPEADQHQRPGGGLRRGGGAPRAGRLREFEIDRADAAAGAARIVE